eukprot:CAMPEP_0118932676 /NCGR_PEP_ID=MMETSP1169-20130426/10562_1 /TAXON_ID=36882 /ORGANISM="Pyramimonas obovata, Strain CCMP722" /LENGTH=240 /DNA_ID=CAMNT_0006875371 /DNA_START=113 /DNA_END=835 /DNA_ORIENTATION=+
MALRQQRHLATDKSFMTRSRKAGQTCRKSARVFMAVKENRDRFVEKGVSTMRRDVLATIVFGASAFGMEPLPCEAGVLDSLKDMKRDNNAKFLVGPIRLSRQRMFTVLALTEGNSPEYGEARAALQKASLDCLEPASGLTGYAKFRDVCTYGIVYKSVTKGPAAMHESDSPEFKEITNSIVALIRGLKNLDALLASSAEGDAEAPKLFSSNFSSTIAALDRFELAIQSCLGYEPDLDRVL